MDNTNSQNSNFIMVDPKASLLHRQMVWVNKVSRNNVLNIHKVTSDNLQAEVVLEVDISNNNFKMANEVAIKIREIRLIWNSLNPIDRIFPNNHNLASPSTNQLSSISIPSRR